MQLQNKTERKIPEIFFMNCKEKIYHIYAKDQCLFHSLKEEEFKNTWNTLHQMMGVMKTDYTVNDLNYIEILPGIGGGGGDSSPEPPGSPSY
jgi:hypothetical protein